MAFIPYLSFQGQCTKTFATYGHIFGAIPQMRRFSDMPPGEGMPPLTQDQKNWVMHAQLITPEGDVLMGADIPPQFGGQAQAGVSISVTRDDLDMARVLFGLLAEDGQITMPFGPSFFARGFGMCRDQFGTSWMVNVPAKNQ
ncbi:MAG: VOC family protein [Paracoccus sp. (in: a-proteobacteria)]